LRTLAQPSVTTTVHVLDSSRRRSGRSTASGSETRTDVEFIVELISPPDRERLAASVMVDGEQLAEINQERDRPTLELYPRRDGQFWVLDYEEAMAALVRAKTGLLGDD